MSVYWRVDNIPMWTDNFPTLANNVPFPFKDMFQYLLNTAHCLSVHLYISVHYSQYIQETRRALKCRLCSCEKENGGIHAHPRNEDQNRSTQFIPPTSLLTEDRVTFFCQLYV